MSEPASFRTKTGRCIVTPDSLQLEREGVRGAMAEAMFGKDKRRAVLIYVSIVIVLIWTAAMSWRTGDLVGTVLWAGLAVLVLRTVARGRDLSAKAELARAATRRIEVVPGRRGLTRSHLIVHFEEDGDPARRLILLPGVLQGGPAELDRAVSTLRAAGWPVESPPA
jgi:nitric oxide synthase oxygenase domain/subunit